MKILPVTILSAVDTGSATGSAINTNQMVRASFCPIFGDVSAAGTVKIQGSNDYPTSGLPNANAFTPTNWNDITGATSTISSGVGPAIVVEMCFYWIRAVYTRSSGGSTTVKVFMFALSP